MKQCPTCRTMRNPYGFKSHVKWCGVPFNEQQFWDSMERLPWSGCWIWTKASLHYGYGGVVWYPHPGAKHVLTGIHRVAWILTYGPIPPKMEVMHTCDVTPCGNPAHLKLGTHLENMADARAKDRHCRGDRGRSKLTEAEAREILSLKGTGPAMPIAEKYGVGPGAITAIWRRMYWKHLDGCSQ